MQLGDEDAAQQHGLKIAMDYMGGAETMNDAVALACAKTHIERVNFPLSNLTIEVA